MPATQWEPQGEEEKKGRLTKSPHHGPHVAAAAFCLPRGTNPPEGRAVTVQTPRHSVTADSDGSLPLIWVNEYWLRVSIDFLVI